MDHLAIMKKGIGSIEDILSGVKGIESRWSKRKIAPYDKINQGDIIYFKYSSDKKITTCAHVREVMQFELNKDKLSEILNKYGGRGNINLKNMNPNEPYFSDKRYCVLVFLKDPKKVEPFEITKKGYGTAWFCLENIDSIKRTH